MRAPDPPPFRVTRDGALLMVRLTPRGGRDAVLGLEAGPDGPRLAASVRAVPDKGAANTALERLIADWLDVPRSTVSLARGGKSRYKAVALSGQPEKLARLLADRLSQLS